MTIPGAPVFVREAPVVVLGAVVQPIAPQVKQVAS